MRSIYISDRRMCAFVSVTSCNAISRNLHIFLYARGSNFHRISAEILFHSAAFSIIPFLEQAPYPVEEARAKPIPPRICWYILQFLGLEFDFSTRVFFFLFVHGLDIDSQRNFHREFRWKTIHESLISLPFPRLQLDDVQEDLKR